MADLAREEGAASDDGEAEKKSELAPKEVEQEQPRSLLKAGQSSSFDASFASRTTAAPVPSLFPISGNVPYATHSWLSNSSFSQNPLPPPSSFSESLLPPPSSFLGSKANEQLPGKDVVDEVEKREVKGGRVRPEATSSASDPESSDGERSRHKKKRHRKRKEKEKEEERKRRKKRKQTGDDLQIGSLEAQSGDRKTGVKAWADAKENVAKEYYVDTRGDRDNLAFGSLYRLDVARYFRQECEGVREGSRKRTAAHLDTEPDGDVPETKAYRYWSGDAIALELRRDIRRLRVRPPNPSATKMVDQKLDDYIPLASKETNKKGEGDAQEEGENGNDYIIRRTREFNTLTRERPDDENSWLEFAKFQDELIHIALRKGVKQQAVEKKIAVLEKALEHHPDSLPLTLTYLEACSLRDTVPEMLSKWEKAALVLGGNYHFWKEFLQYVCSQFSLFTVATVRAMYIRALGALTTVRDRLKIEGGDWASLKSAELAMVSILVDRCRFELQTGHAELGLGIFQAAIEYSLFPPLIQTSENNKRRLFEAFWDSEASRIGEKGALGWALWLENEEYKFQRAQADEAAQEEQAPGGWSGWTEPVKKSEANKTNDEANVGNESSDEGDEDEEVGAESDEDEATLLSKLGLSSVDAGKELEATDPGVWLRWAAEERKRSWEQWLPTRAQPEVDEEQDEQLDRVVMFEDIRNALVSIYSEEALCWLIGHFFNFCNIPLSNWCSSNDIKSQQSIEGLDSLTDTLSRVRGIRSTGSNISHYVGSNREIQQLRPGETALRELVGESEWFLDSLDRAQFACNALLLLQSTSSLNSLPGRHWDLTETLILVQSLASDTGVKASRNLAKKLLKTHSQDIALWTAYALVEGAAGHMDTARKVFDTALASILALPNESQDDAPLLYLACADMEMSHGSKNRALYILCHFGGGIPYTSSSNVEDPIPPTILLKAKLGYQQHLQNIRRRRTYVRDAASLNTKPSFGRDLDERGVAVIACVGLFEELSSGWEAAASTFEESFAFTLPGKWKESKECEALMERYVGLLKRSTPAGKPAQIRRIAMRGLQNYPHNSVLLETLVQSSSSTTYNLRRYFDESVKRNPSTLLWMFALATELGTDKGNSSRIQCLFERALEAKATQHSVLLWRTYLAYECKIHRNFESARRIYFRAIHACPWSKKLWLDGFTMLNSVLTAKQLAEFQEIMREKELRLRTDVYEILLQDTGDNS